MRGNCLPIVSELAPARDLPRSFSRQAPVGAGIGVGATNVELPAG